MADDSLDISERQIIVHLPEHEDGDIWMHCILIKQREGSTWSVLDAEMSQKFMNLSDLEFRVLERAESFPSDVIDDVLTFNDGDITRTVLNRARRGADARISLMGAGAVGVANSGWVVAETPSKSFEVVLDDDQIDLALLGEDKGVAVVKDIEVFVQKINLDQIDEWKTSKTGMAGDVRLLGTSMDTKGRRYLPFDEGVSLLEETPMVDWRVPGPRGAKEWLTAVATGPGDLQSYHLNWLLLN